MIDTPKGILTPDEIYDWAMTQINTNVAYETYKIQLYEVEYIMDTLRERWRKQKQINFWSRM